MRAILILLAMVQTAAAVQIIDLGKTGESSYAAGINIQGQVVGYSYAPYGDYVNQRAFLYPKPGTFMVPSEGGANAINAAGHVVGSWIVNNQTHGFLYDGTRMIDIAGPTFVTACYGINNHDVVVGDMYVQHCPNCGYEQHAFMWQNGVITDLNTFLPPNSGWVLEFASGINDRNEICGIAVLPNSEAHAFLLKF